MTLFLPLHIWDRELDSRILIGVLASKYKINTAIGHEYNLAEIYSLFPYSTLYRAGRPRNNYRLDWNKTIIDGGGKAHIVDEEGNNDLENAAKNMKYSYLPGVDKKSIDYCSSIHTWCQLHKNTIEASISNEFTSSIQDKFVNLLNPRLEILSQTTNMYFDRRCQAIKDFFGNFVLVSDNFGTKVFGLGNMVDPNAYLGQDTSAERIQEIKNHHEKLKKRGERFAALIRKLVTTNPDILFIFRPHPISSISTWHKLLGEHRNLCVIYKDAADPWLKAANSLIHAGCTTGLQSILLGTKTIDISNLIDSNISGKAPLSSQISTQAKSLEGLASTIRSHFYAEQSGINNKNTNAFDSTQTKNFHQFLSSLQAEIESAYSKFEIVNSLLSNGLKLSSCSSFTWILESAIQTQKIALSHGVTCSDEINRLFKALQRTANKSLPAGKISYLSKEEISLRIKDAACAIGCEPPQHFYSRSHKILIIKGRSA